MSEAGGGKGEAGMSGSSKLLHHERSGAGGPPPLVFVHGFGCALSDWRLQRGSLQHEYETLACDLPGHGASDPPRGGAPSIDGCARAVVEMLDALDLPPAVLTGHSLGCRVVMQARIEAPERVAGLVLVDGSRIGSGDPEAARARARAAFETAGYGATVRRLFEEMFLAGASDALAIPILERAARLPERIGVALFADLVAWDAGRAGQVLPALGDLPVAVVQSTRLDEDRRRRPLRSGESTPWLDLVRAERPDARIEIAPGVGHFTMLESPAAVNRLVRETAVRVRAAGG